MKRRDFLATGIAAAAAPKSVATPRVFYAQYVSGGAFVGDSWTVKLDATDAAAAWAEMRAKFPSSWAVYSGQVLSRMETTVDGEEVRGKFKQESGCFYPEARKVGPLSEFGGHTPYNCKRMGATHAVRTRCGWERPFYPEKDVAEVK